MTYSRQRIAILCITAAAAACEIPTTGVSGNPVGVGSLTARTKGSEYTTSPVLTFYRVTGAAFITTEGTRDTCFQTGFSETQQPVTSSATPVSAGAYVAYRVGAKADTLKRTTTATDPSYRTATPAGMTFTPGDSIVINVAGDQNGFPTSEFRGRTAEPFVVNPFEIPEAGTEILLTWTPAGGADAAMLMSFSFAAGTSTTRNRQIACTFVDDGASSVPGLTAADWINATNRTMSAQRIRTILAQVDVPRSFFNIISSFNWPTPVSP